MRFLTLNLHARLAFGDAGASGPRDLGEILAEAAQAPEGTELGISWPWEAAVREGLDDGPEAARPLPPAVDPSPSGELGLEPGLYLFTQDRWTGADDAEAWLAERITWFAREAWWAGGKAEGPLYLRLVREDGKTAAQLLRRRAP